jgi:hypothetical protein
MKIKLGGRRDRPACQSKSYDGLHAYFGGDDGGNSAKIAAIRWESSSLWRATGTTELDRTCATRCSGRNSHRSGFKVANLVIFHGITHLDRLAAHFAVFHIGLSLDRGVQYHRNPLTAVRAYEEILHRLKDTAFPFALSNCTIFRILGGFAFASRSRNSRSPFPPRARFFLRVRGGSPVFRSGRAFSDIGGGADARVPRQPTERGSGFGARNAIGPTLCVAAAAMCGHTPRVAGRRRTMRLLHGVEWTPRLGACAASSPALLPLRQCIDCFYRDGNYIGGRGTHAVLHRWRRACRRGRRNSSALFACLR